MVYHGRIEKIRLRPDLGFITISNFILEMQGLIIIIAKVPYKRKIRACIRKCFIVLLNKEGVQYQIKFHIFYLWLRLYSSGMGCQNRFTRLRFNIAISEFIDPLKRCCMGIWVCSILSWTRKCILWWAMSWWRSNFKLHYQLWK